MTHTTLPTAGVNFGLPSPVAFVEVGTVMIGRQNTTYIYGQASGAVPVGNCDVDASFNITTGAGDFTCDVAIPAAAFGWVRQNNDFIPTSGGAFGLMNVVEDLTPQLGGFLDMNGNDIDGADARGPSIRDADSLLTAVINPNKADDDTGIGWRAANQFDLIAGTVSALTVQSAQMQARVNLILESANLQASDAAGPAVLDEAASAINPTLIPDRGDLTSGIAGVAADQSVLILGAGSTLAAFDPGNAVIEFSGFNVSLAAGTGPILMQENASSTNPTVCPSKLDQDTGLGIGGADALVLVSGGVQVLTTTATLGTIGPANYQLQGSDAAGPSILNEPSSATNPTLVPDRGDLTTGIGGTSGNLSLVRNSVEEFRVQAGQLTAGTITGASILNTAASGTVPTLIPQSQDLDTGIGRSASDILSLICGGITAVEYRDNGPGLVLWQPNTRTGITAFAGGGQGSATPLTNSFEDVTTVASPGDSVVLPGANLPRIMYVFNAGANACDVFPAVGDDLGAGLNTAVSLAVNTGTMFMAIDANTWRQMF